MTELSEKRIKQLYDPDYFYQHGMNPALKNLIKISQENNISPHNSLRKTYVLGGPPKLHPARDIIDFYQRDLGVNTFMRCIPIMLINLAMAMSAYRTVQTVFPVGRYGYTKISQTPFYRTWGRLGVAGIGVYVGVVGYIFSKTFAFSANKFYHHVILQERNYGLEYRKVMGSNLDYFFQDTPLGYAKGDYSDVEALEKQKTVQPPKWFK